MQEGQVEGIGYLLEGGRCRRVLGRIFRNFSSVNEEVVSYRYQKFFVNLRFIGIYVIVKSQCIFGVFYFLVFLDFEF